MADKTKETDSSKQKPETAPGKKKPGDEEEDDATRSGKESSEESDETKGEDEGKEGEAEEGKEKPKSKPAEKTLTQSQVNRIVKTALEKEREKWDSERDEAEAVRGKDFEALAETRKAKLDKLEKGYATLQVSYTDLVDASTAYVVAELNELPAEVLALAPVDLPTEKSELEELELEGELLVKLAKWIPKAKASAAALTGEEKSMPGFGKRPGTKGKPQDSERSTEEVKQGARKTGRYGF